MFEKRKAKKIIEEKLEKDTPDISSLSQPGKSKKFSPLKFWMITGSAVAAVGVAIASGYGIYKALNPVSDNDLSEIQISKPAARVYSGSVTSKSASIYSAFAKKLVPLIFSETATSSRAFSVFDAFVSVSMMIYCSSDSVQNNYCALLGAATMDEVSTAVRELSLTLGVNREYVDPVDKKTKTVGGASVNSFWINQSIPLADSADGILSGLQNDYFASIYHESASTDRLAKWLSDNAPVGFDDLPKLHLDDEPDTSSVSAFFVKDSFDDDTELALYNQYKSQKHYLNYLLDSITQQVDYVFTQREGFLLKGDDFTGVHSSINELGIDYFLPDEGYSPNDIMQKVVAESYANEAEYYLQISAPYFLIRTEDFDFTEDLKAMSPLFGGALMSKLIDESIYEQVLSSALQSSVLKYDYSGFYAVSITAANTKATSAPGSQYPDYDFTLNRPYAFVVNYPVTLVGDTSSTNLPLFYGQVFDPAYA